jgi:general secretion pathway protein D
MNKASVIGLATALVLLLAACASNRSYQEGLELVGQGNDVAALQKLQDALRDDPRNPEYRVALINTRERIVRRLLEQAERANSAGKPAQAVDAYQRVLAVDANNARARAGLTLIERDRRHATLLQEVDEALSKGASDTAQQKLRQVLAENPDQPEARAQQRKLALASQRSTETPQLAAALRKPITIEFRDAPIKQVFEVLARTSGLNFIFDRDVRTDQRTTIFLRNSTVEAAVNLLLLTNQLEQRIVDVSTVIIYPNTAAKLREYQQLVVRSFWLATADARQVANTIRTIVRSRDVVVDEKLNMIIVRDSPEAIRMAERLVVLHDATEPEVMLEVEILEVKRSRLLELGIRWPGQLSLTPLPSTTGGTLTLEDLRNLSAGRIGATIDPLTIQARRLDTDTNLLANPRIRARNRERARILIGDRLPTITSTSTATGFVSESVNYIDVGLKLDVEPTIYLDGEVAIKVALEVSNIVSQVQTRSGTLAYQLGTRSASTTLRLRDGENQVLAGLIQDDDRRSAARVPGFGDVPGLNRLFGTQLDDNAKTEIVLSITPRLIRNVQRLEAYQSEFDAGTEASLRSRAGGEGGAAPPPAAATPLGPAPSGRADDRPAGPQQPSASAAPFGSPLAAPSSPSAGSSVFSPNPGMPSSGSPPSAPIDAIGPSGAVPTGGAPPATVTPSPAGVAQTVAPLTWQGPSAVKVGDNFVLQLTLQSDTPLTSVPLTLSFDPAVLQALAVTEGDFMRRGGAQTSFTSRIDPTGQILVTASRVAGAASGNASLFSVTFVARSAADATRVQLQNVAPVGLDGRSVTAAPPTPFAVRVTQ